MLREGDVDRLLHLIRVTSGKAGLTDDTMERIARRLKHCDKARRSEMININVDQWWTAAVESIENESDEEDDSYEGIVQHKYRREELKKKKAAQLQQQNSALSNNGNNNPHFLSASSKSFVGRNFNNSSNNNMINGSSASLLMLSRNNSAVFPNGEKSRAPRSRSGSTVLFASPTPLLPPQSPQQNATSLLSSGPLPPLNHSLSLASIGKSPTAAGMNNNLFGSSSPQQQQQQQLHSPITLSPIHSNNNKGMNSPSHLTELHSSGGGGKKLKSGGLLFGAAGGEMIAGYAKNGEGQRRGRSRSRSRGRGEGSRSRSRSRRRGGGGASTSGEEDDDFDNDGGGRRRGRTAGQAKIATVSGAFGPSTPQTTFRPATTGPAFVSFGPKKDHHTNSRSPPNKGRSSSRSKRHFLNNTFGGRVSSNDVSNNKKKKNGSTIAVGSGAAAAAAGSRRNSVMLMAGEGGSGKESFASQKGLMIQHNNSSINLQMDDLSDYSGSEADHPPRRGRRDSVNSITSPVSTSHSPARPLTVMGDDLAGGRRIERYHGEREGRRRGHRDRHSSSSPSPSRGSSRRRAATSIPWISAQVPNMKSVTDDELRLREEIITLFREVQRGTNELRRMPSPTRGGSSPPRTATATMNGTASDRDFIVANVGKCEEYTIEGSKARLERMKKEREEKKQMVRNKAKQLEKERSEKLAQFSFDERRRMKLEKEARERERQEREEKTMSMLFILCLGMSSKGLIECYELGLIRREERRKKDAAAAMIQRFMKRHCAVGIFNKAQIISLRLLRAKKFGARIRRRIQLTRERHEFAVTVIRTFFKEMVTISLRFRIVKHKIRQAVMCAQRAVRMFLKVAHVQLQQLCNQWHDIERTEYSRFSAGERTETVGGGVEFVRRSDNDRVLAARKIKRQMSIGDVALLASMRGIGTQRSSLHLGSLVEGGLEEVIKSRGGTPREEQPEEEAPPKKSRDELEAEIRAKYAPEKENRIELQIVGPPGSSEIQKEVLIVMNERLRKKLFQTKLQFYEKMELNKREWFKWRRTLLQNLVNLQSQDPGAAPHRHLARIHALFPPPATMHPFVARFTDDEMRQEVRKGHMEAVRRVQLRNSLKELDASHPPH